MSAPTEADPAPEDDGATNTTPPDRSAPSNLLTLVAGAFSAEVDRIFAGPRVVDCVMAADARRHVWHCCLASERTGAGWRADPEAAFARLTTAKSRDLLAGAYGACPAGLIGALGRCGVGAHGPAFYRALVSALARDDGGARLLRHAPTLSDALVLTVAALPPRLEPESLFEALRKGDISAADVAHLAWAATRLEALGVSGGTEAILGAPLPIGAFARALRNVALPATALARRRPSAPGSVAGRLAVGRGGARQLPCTARIGRQDRG